MTRGMVESGWGMRAVVLGCLALLAGACERLLPTDGTETTVPLRITAVTVGTPISTLVVQVTASDIPTPLVFNLSVANGVASGTIKIPPGPARMIDVTAMNAQGNVTHEGSATIDVRPGQNPPVQIKLGPRSGQVPITVTFGNFGVVVTPPTATINVPVAATLQLSVSVTDVNGQVIPAPAVEWATTSPAVATVSATGLVTGVRDGEATVVATYEGVAGLSSVTVKGFGETVTFQYPTCLTPDEIELANAINDTRRQVGLAPVPVDTRLVQAARANAASGLSSAFVFGQIYGYDGSNAGNRGSGFTSATSYWAAILADTVTSSQRRALVDGYYLSANTHHIGVGFSQAVRGWGDMAGLLDAPVDLTGSCDP